MTLAELFLQRDMEFKRRIISISQRRHFHACLKLLDWGSGSFAGLGEPGPAHSKVDATPVQRQGSSKYPLALEELW